MFTCLAGGEKHQGMLLHQHSRHARQHTPLFHDEEQNVVQVHWKDVSHSGVIAHRKSGTCLVCLNHEEHLTQRPRPLSEHFIRGHRDDGTE